MLQAMRLAAETTRLRILLLLEKEELSVAELQEILATGQSTISTHLAQLKQGQLVEDRRTGKSTLYRLRAPEGQAGKRMDELMNLLRHSAAELGEARDDAAALQLTLRKRQEKMRAYFDQMAGKFGKQYVPGRSWQALTEMLLALQPPMVIADLGAGEGSLAQLLARRARQVIAVDNSDKMVEFGAALAGKHQLANLEYRKGDLEALPIDDAGVDLALFSQSLHHAQHPGRAVSEAFRILRPGGRIAVLDLQRHHFEQARDLYADLWLGFTQVELTAFLNSAGFVDIQTSLVHRELEAPHFETVLATAQKPQ